MKVGTVLAWMRPNGPDDPASAPAGASGTQDKGRKRMRGRLIAGFFGVASPTGRLVPVVMALIVFATMSGATSRATARIIATGFNDFSAAGLNGPIVIDQEFNTCTFFGFVNVCDSVPTAVNVSNSFSMASASTDGHGGSELAIGVGGGFATSNDFVSRTVESGEFLILPLSGSFNVTLRAFFPEISLSGEFFGPGISLSYEITVELRDPDLLPPSPPTKDFVTGGGFVTDATGQPLFIPTGADIGAQLITDPTTGERTVSVQNLVLDIDLGQPPSGNDFEIFVRKELRYSNPNGSQLEFASLRMVDPFFVSGGDHLLLDNATFTEQTTIPEPATLAIFAFGLAGLGFMRRRRRVA